MKYMKNSTWHKKRECMNKNTYTECKRRKEKGKKERMKGKIKFQLVPGQKPSMFNKQVVINFHIDTVLNSFAFHYNCGTMRGNKI